DQHVLDAVHHIDEAVLVDAPDVAGVVPAVNEGRRGGLGLLPIAFHDIGAIDADLADLADRQGVAVRIGDLDVVDRRRQAYAFRPLQIVLAGAAGGDRGGLGGAVALAGPGGGEEFLGLLRQ